MNQRDRPPKNPGYKTWFDLSVLAVAHVVLFPLWVVLWTMIPLGIWLADRGPVFFRQERVGKDGQIFTILKFRTMIPDADKAGPAWTTEGDPRITPVGRILRRTALDELPGLISIWRGHMSFVGPRALDRNEQRQLEELIPGFEKRLQIRPGLTGLAQVYDKNDDPHEKFRFDMEYLERQNVFLDARLLLQSVLNTLVARWDRRSGKVSLENFTAGGAKSPLGGLDTAEPEIQIQDDAHQDSHSSESGNPNDRNSTLG